MTRFPRIAPGRRPDVGALVWLISAAAGRRQHTGPPNLFLTLGRHRRLAWGWLAFAAQLMPRGRLSRRDTELVILRVAARCGCDYELEHHKHLATQARLTPAEIDAALVGANARGLSPRQHAVLAFVDQLVADGDVDDEVWHTAAGHLDDRQLIELCMLIGHYTMLASTIRVLRVQTDRRRDERDEHASGAVATRRGA